MQSMQSQAMQSHAIVRAGGHVCLQVPVSGQYVTAYLTQTTWRARYGESRDDDDFLDVVEAHHDMIDAAVVRKLAAGARAPIVLRAEDL